MASFFRRDFTSGFSLDRIEVQETARRQFFISAVMVAVILCFATLAALRENMRPAYKPAEVTGRDDFSAESDQNPCAVCRQVWLPAPGRRRFDQKLISEAANR